MYLIITEFSIDKMLLLLDVVNITEKSYFLLSYYNIKEKLVIYNRNEHIYLCFEHKYQT